MLLNIQIPVSFLQKNILATQIWMLVLYIYIYRKLLYPFLITLTDEKSATEIRMTQLWDLLYKHISKNVVVRKKTIFGFISVSLIMDNSIFNNKTSRPIFSFLLACV